MNSESDKKGLARDAQATVPIIDEYCQAYRSLFQDVRSYECFKYLHLAILASSGRKSLPELAKVVNLPSAQSLHHFLANSPWSVSEMKIQRLMQILAAVAGREVALLIDETGDRKKGKVADYVARQYLGSIGKVDSGIVSVNAYGICEGITFPLLCEVFKPKGRLKEGDIYQSKPEIATGLVSQLVEMGFKFQVVLADSLYGESSQFIQALEKHELSWVLSIRSNHGVLMPAGGRVRWNRWCKFKRHLSGQQVEERYIRELVFGKRRQRTYWQLTTEPETLPAASTSFVMTNIQRKPSELKQMLGDWYGLRTWVEYGFRPCKQELGWTAYRLTRFRDIERWWELIFSVYSLVSLQSWRQLDAREKTSAGELHTTSPEIASRLHQHPGWSETCRWKDTLKNLRLLIQPVIMPWLLCPRLSLFENSDLLRGFHQLLRQVNQAQAYFLHA
jgi:SRSO17 transposase